VRVVAGRLRGRTLRAPRGNETRPTSARVREALFSLLGPTEALDVLDLYAGSGALAIEALSRGARRALLVEQSTTALACLRDNLQRLDLTEVAAILARDVHRSLQRVVDFGKVDLVLCDPPYAQLSRALGFLGRLTEAGCLNDDARIVLEHAARDRDVVSPHPLLVVGTQRRWGDTGVTVLSYRGPIDIPRTRN